MSLPYTVLGNVTGSVYSASFLNETDYKLFNVSQINDIWYGFSPNDVIEFSVQRDLGIGNMLFVEFAHGKTAAAGPCAMRQQHIVPAVG